MAGADEENAKDAITTPAMLDGACITRVLQLVDGVATLARAAAVCRAWRTAVEADSVWREVYLRSYGPPEAYERLDSYKALTRRAMGFHGLPSLIPALIKGTALCYSAARRCLVAYNSRQRLLSAQPEPGGAVRSAILEDEGGATAAKPQVAATDCGRVVLAAFDGMLQVWDLASHRLEAVLGRHPTFVTALAASGDVLASACTSELKIWSLSSRKCLYSAPLSLAAMGGLVSIEPRLAASVRHGLVVLANHSFPSENLHVLAIPCSAKDACGVSGAAKSAEGSLCTGSMAVNSERAAGGGGMQRVGELLRVLPANAVSDVAVYQDLVIAVSCFHGRGVSTTAAAHGTERPYTLVAHLWDVHTWACTRRVSPRLWSDYPASASAGLPVIHATQGLLLCAVLRSQANRSPFCAVHVWRLPPPVANRTGPPSPGCSGATGSQQPQDGKRGSAGLSRSHHGTDQGSPVRLTVSVARNDPAVGSNAESSSSATGANVLPVLWAPLSHGARRSGSRDTVMLVVPEERDAQEWGTLVDDTRGKVVALLSTPHQLAITTDLGHVYTAPIAGHSAVRGCLSGN